MSKEEKNLVWFKDVSKKDVALVGGKNASLGEMIRELSSKGVSVPDGFATTSKAYRLFIEENNLREKIKEILRGLNISDVRDLKRRGEKIRKIILKGKIPHQLEVEIKEFYLKLCQKYGKDTDVAVRSSATAEDLTEASFAGQMETFLNVRGERDLMIYTKRCLASLFTDRSISYREKLGFDHLEIALSIGVQKMVRSDKACSGVIFTIDTETGFRDSVLITGSYGVGEFIVQGRVVPDEFQVFKPTLKEGFKPLIVKNLGRKKQKLVYGKKGLLLQNVLEAERNSFCLTEGEVLKLAQWSLIIEDHYKRPMDIEWAKDGKTGELFIVQARPETIYSLKETVSYKEYSLKEENPKVLLEGIAIGQKIAKGRARVIKSAKRISEFKEGEVLITTITDPDWEPIMKKAKAIITDLGGRTSHAAIVSRELGVPCIVGTQKATLTIKTGQEITVDCSQGETGKIYAGGVDWEEKEYKLKKIPKIKTKIMVNIGTPEMAFSNSFLPHEGVGLAREEFIIASKIKVHPLALVNYEKLDSSLKREIDKISYGYKDKKQFFVDELTRGVGQIAAAFYPKPVIVRFSDFKTNEYETLLGGSQFEPKEENPMIGFRGASRYYDPQFKEAFLLECRAMKKAREEFGLKNIWAMIPFCRTPEEGEKVLKIMEAEGLKRSFSAGKQRDELKIIVMCEIPSNVILAEEFLKIFDGMSIGSNDLTQLTLGIDRDSSTLKKVGDERNEAVKEMIRQVIKICKKKKKYIGICGQAPSDFPEFASFLVEEGIESMSLNPDTVIPTILSIAKKKPFKK